ncbi:MAG: sulfatase-like hydrolase/transferase, partial [Bacteroidota bacterium]
MRKVKLLIFVLISMFALNSAKSQVKKPNFLFIITDDQTYNAIHALGNNEIKTPNMDRLVDEGFTFTHAFNPGSWTAAVCIASRCMLNTGQSVFRASKNISYFPRKKQNVEDRTEVPLWGEVLRQNGYENFLTGKWHLSDKAALKSFDFAHAIGQGMYETYDSQGSKAPGYNREKADDTPWKPWEKEFTGHWAPKVKDIIYDENESAKIGAFYTVNQHTSELYADNAINYLLTKAKNSDKPFFMYVAFNAPHDPRQSPKEFVDMYPVEKIDIPTNYLPEHPFNQGDNRVRDEKLAPFPRSKDAVQLHRSEYYAIITHADREIGRILKALEVSGKMDNTYVILTSDHGLAVGQHGLIGKQNLYDHSIRMPLIIKGPGLEAGEKSDEMVYLQSMYATTCELAGIQIPETVEYKSLKDLMIKDSA